MGRKQTRRRKYLYFCLAGLMFLSSWGCAIPEKMRIGIRPQSEAHQRLLQARELLGQKDFEGALRKNQEILSLATHQSPEDEALFYTGMIYVHPENLQRDSAKSLYFFDRVAEDYPKSPWAVQARAWMGMLQESGRLNQRVEHLNHRVEHLNQQVEQLNHQVKHLQQEKIKIEEEQEVRRPLLNSRDLLSQGKYEEAIKVIHKVLAASPRHPLEDDALFQLGLIFASYGNPKRDYGKSLGYFRRLIKDYPQSLWAEPAKTWIGVVQENDKLNQNVEKLNQMIEKSKQVDIEIEEKKREKGK
jgi:tetratricopeptide (TPR) repeat protein